VIKQHWKVGVQFVLQIPKRRDAFNNGDEFTFEMGPVHEVPVTTNGGMLTKGGFESRLDPSRRSNRFWLFMCARKALNNDLELSRKFPKDRFVPVGYTKIEELKLGGKR
jgi:hypothetical protein